MKTKTIIFAVSAAMACAPTAQANPMNDLPPKGDSARGTQTSVSSECAEAHAGGDEAPSASPEARRAAMQAVQDFIESKDFTGREPITSTMLDTMDVYASENGHTVAQIPLDGAGGNFTFDLSPTFHVGHYSESHLKPLSDDAGHVTLYRDGQILIDRMVTSKDLTKTANGEMTNAGVKNFFPKLNECLSNAGIAAWLVTAAVLACGPAGPWAAVTCLVGAGIGFGTASYCVRWALRH